MNKVNENAKSNIKIIKHYIRDLSFENPQTVNENNATNNNNNKISENMSFVHESFENNFFGITMKYSCECLSTIIGKKLFILELDYFGLFELLSDKSYNQAELTKEGAELIFPFVKSIVEDTSKKGGSVSISLKDIDFKLIQN